MPRFVFIMAPLALLLAVGFALQATGEDTIVVVGSEGRTHRYFGSIQDYTGETLRIFTSTREMEFPAEQVVNILTTLTPAHVQANELFETGEYGAALDAYNEAVGGEPRVWVKRMILDSMVWAQRRSGQPVDAASTFLLLVQSDPTTPYMGAIPLEWQSAPPDPRTRQQAAVWINDPRPVAQLIAASWLLSGGNRQQAIATLSQLADRSDDARIARLARTQLWRTELLTADAATLARWERYIAAMPPALRAGPTYLLGKSLARLGESEQAALELLKVPILYPEQAELAPEALAAAGGELEKLGRPREAARLYREAVRDYPQSPLVDSLKEKIELLEDAPAG